MDAREIGGLFVDRGHGQAGWRSGESRAGGERGAGESSSPPDPRPAELQRAKAGIRADFVRGVERIGGGGGKSDVLAQGEVYAGRPDYYKTRLQRIAGATAAQIRADGQSLARPTETIPSRCSPSASTGSPPRGSIAASCPRPAAPPEAAFPAFERDTLANGLKIVLARATVHPPGALRPAARRRLRGRPVRHSRHRQSGDGDAGRGDPDPQRDRHQRRAPLARREPLHRFRPRHVRA